MRMPWAPFSHGSQGQGGIEMDVGDPGNGERAVIFECRQRRFGGTATRTISQTAYFGAADLLQGRFRIFGRVLVMDGWIETGWEPPMPTRPTNISFS